MGREQRLVVVTGASRGVGAATARALVQEHGCTVLAVSRDIVGLGALKDACAGGAGWVEPLPLDLGQPDAAAHVVAAVDGRRARALVHCAGTLQRREIGRYMRQDLESLFTVNVFAPLELSQALAGALAGDPPGHIVHIGSMGGFQDSAKFAGLVAYSSAKAALACMAQCLAEEFVERGVRSNCLALGAVDTAMLREAFPGYRAPVGAEAMGTYVARFALEGHFLFNGKVLPVALGTP